MTTACRYMTSVALKVLITRGRWISPRNSLAQGYVCVYMYVLFS
jgi:hypothetical protein